MKMIEMNEGEKKVVVPFGLDEGEAANVVNYVTVAAHGGHYRLGSLNTDEILDWLGEGKDDAKRKVSGVRLLLRCICDANGGRYTEKGKATDRYERAVAKFIEKDARDNKILIAAAMELNGLGDITAALAKAKNA